MKLKKAEQLAKKLMRQHLPKGENNWVFMWSNATKFFGLCSYGISGTFIKLSKKFVVLNSEEETKETLLHEIAHAIDVNIRGGTNHDYIWKIIAKHIGSTGDTCFNNEVIRPKLKYSTICNTCDLRPLS